MARTFESTSVAIEKAPGPVSKSGGGGFPPAVSPMFQQGVILKFEPNALDAVASIETPVGAALEIEMVTANIAVGPGEQPFLFIETTVGGRYVAHTITLEPLPLLARHFQATHCVSLYADPNTAIGVRLHRTAASDPHAFKVSAVSVSGRMR